MRKPDVSCPWRSISGKLPFCTNFLSLFPKLRETRHKESFIKMKKIQKVTWGVRVWRAGSKGSTRQHVSPMCELQVPWGDGKKKEEILLWSQGCLQQKPSVENVGGGAGEWAGMKPRVRGSTWEL